MGGLFPHVDWREKPLYQGAGKCTGEKRVSALVAWPEFCPVDIMGGAGTHWGGGLAMQWMPAELGQVVLNKALGMQGDGPRVLCPFGMFVGQTVLWSIACCLLHHCHNNPEK